MKTIISIIFFAFQFCVPVLAQDDNPACPSIIVTAPRSIIQPGETMTFSVSIGSGIKNYDIKYKWTVDVGMIIDGQNTTTVQVSTEGFDDQVVTATFEIEGLPGICNSEYSGAGVVGTGLSRDPLDRSGKIPIEDELARFDALLIELNNNPKYKGYVRIATDENESVLSVKKHIRKLGETYNKKKNFAGKNIFCD